MGRYGYVGVDVFFALSGFLITSLLLSEKDTTGRISLTHFYLRRVLRLYPALLVCSAGVLVLAVVGKELAKLVGPVLASLFYYANWWLYTGHDMVLLDHTWTLSIEEHYYLLWAPIMALALSGNRRLRALGVAAAALVVGVLGVSWGDDLDAVRGSYLRGAPIIAGSLLAILLRHPAVREPLRRFAALLGAVGLVVICWIVLTPFPLPEAWLQGVASVPGYASLAVLGAVVLRPQSMAARLLALASLRWTGRRAYGLYLYHFPILSLALHQLSVPSPPVVRAAIGVVLTFVVAALSYRFVERPALRLKARFEPARRPVTQADA